MRIDDKLLAQALANNNRRFMESFTVNVEPHTFSKRFEKKMSRLIRAENKYSGRLWMERSVSYLTKVAAVILCFVAINYISVTAFELNLWNVIVTKTSEFINITFNGRQGLESELTYQQLSITDMPEGYIVDMQHNQIIEDGQMDEGIYVQHLSSDNGTITYTESLINETVDINIQDGNSAIEHIGQKEVTFVEQEDSVTAFFVDEKYYHIVEVQGEDANIEFASKIIEGLEER